MAGTFKAGETVTLDAGLPLAGEGADPAIMRLLWGTWRVDQTTFPGTMHFTFPTDGDFDLLAFVYAGPTLVAEASWAVSCAADADGDGVVDPSDLCPGTTLPDWPANGLHGARFAAQWDGTFDAGLDKLDGLYTLADTAGCSGTQIMARQGRGEGSAKVGISKNALESFIATLG